MTRIYKIAEDVLLCAMSHDPDVKLIGNVRAVDIAALALSSLITCPKCGSEAFVNIDCDLCLICSQLESGEGL